MARPIFDLCDEYVTRAALLDPVWATMRGIGGSVGAATDFGPEGVAARAELIGEMLRRLARLEPSTEEDRAAADFLGDRLGAERDWYDSGEPLRLVRAPFGPIGTIRDSVDLLPRDSEEAWRAVTARLSAVPVMLASWRAALAVGLQRGLVGARRQAVESAAQADRYVGLDDAPPTHDAVVEAYGEGPLRAELAGAARAAHAAYAETARHLREEYAPRATEADGVGAERHALARRLVLGADIDPIEAYDWGWAELRRIEEEVAAEADRVRPDASLAEAVAVLDETEYVEGADAYREWLQGVHFDIAAPLRRVEVTLAVGSSAGSAYYTPPSEDFTRPGRTWWPLGGRDRFAVWSELTTVFHEGVPGHHLQLGQARVVGERLSRFSRVSGVSGHAEGWALRAARVVIDIGLHLDLPLPAVEAERHGPRWTFEVATDVLRERGHIADHRLHPEVVRYCGWPAQATAYKLGERVWLAARDEARQRAGAAFDLKRWHTRALSLGPVGLGRLAETLRSAQREDRSLRGP